MKPSNWKEINPDPCKDCDRREFDSYGLLCDIWCRKATDYYNREAGADAMLESLKKQGAWLNAGQTLCDLNNAAIIPYKSKGGWLVFIEED